MSIVPITLTVSASMTDIWSAASSDEYTLCVPFGLVIPIGASPTDVIPRGSPVLESIAATVLSPPGVRSVTQIVPPGTWLGDALTVPRTSSATSEAPAIKTAIRLFMSLLSSGKRADRMDAGEGQPGALANALNGLTGGSLESTEARLLLRHVRRADVPTPRPSAASASAVSASRALASSSSRAVMPGRYRSTRYFLMRPTLGRPSAGNNRGFPRD